MLVRQTGDCGVPGQTEPMQFVEIWPRKQCAAWVFCENEESRHHNGMLKSQMVAAEGESAALGLLGTQEGVRSLGLGTRGKQRALSPPILFSQFRGLLSREIRRWLPWGSMHVSCLELCGGTHCSSCDEFWYTLAPPVCPGWLLCTPSGSKRA